MRRLTFASVGLFAAVSLASSLVLADGPVALGDVGQAKPIVPLPVTKKLAAVNVAMKGLGMPALTSLPPANVKLTPVAPLGEGGARIASASRHSFVAPAPQFPDGVFMLEVATGTKSEIKLDVPTEVGKYHVLDCKLTQFFGSSPLVLSVKREGASVQNLNPDDGHYLYTFKADKPKAAFQLTTEHSAAFYGCEVTKL
ncbi:MAG: hypothetical protein U0235_10010 [Polyangiaceae bacterium]